MKIYNFSAGPSKIPTSVINKISKDIHNYQDLGYSILEISPFMFDNINDNNEGGIDSRIYKTTSLSWTITGPVRDVQKTNLRMIQFHEQRVPGLQRYLTDLDEFHQKRHAIAEEDLVDNLYTDGGEYILSDGSAYVGDYHIHPNKGAMVGAVHSDEPHERLYLSLIHI